MITEHRYLYLNENGDLTMTHYEPSLFNSYLVPNRPCTSLYGDNSAHPVQLGYSERTGDYKAVQEESEK